MLIPPEVEGNTFQVLPCAASRLTGLEKGIHELRKSAMRIGAVLGPAIMGAAPPGKNRQQGNESGNEKGLAAGESWYSFRVKCGAARG